MEPRLRSKPFPLSKTEGNRDTNAINIHTEKNGRNIQDTDSEDDQVIMGGRTSADIRSYDDNILLEDEELDRLLIQEKERGKNPHSALAMIQPLRILFPRDRTTSKKFLSKQKKIRKEAIPRKRSQRKNLTLSDRARYSGDENLLFEMEEGSLNKTDSIKSDSDTDEKNDISWRRFPVRDKIRNRKTWKAHCLLLSFILLGISIVLLMIQTIFSGKKAYVFPENLISNGTALFAPTTILISLDGFRSDFLYRGLTPRLSLMIKEGFSPLYMRPSFPSLTFPNHFTLVTGLYPESHGIVGNNFWDDELKEEFHYTEPSAMDPKWWTGEPIWVTAEKQGIKTAVHMWPGSEAHIKDIKPTFLDKFDAQVTLDDKAKRVLELLDKKGYEDIRTESLRPQLIALYAPDVDTDGHVFGPNSTDIRSTILKADQMLDKILIGLEQRNLTNIVNVVVVSDHGMATTDINRMVQLDDLVELDKISHIDGWPLSGLHPKPNLDINSAYQDLSKLAISHQNFDVYLRDVNMPERYHFSKNNRIAPLWIIPKAGWAITTKKEFDIKESKSKGLQYRPRGLHGYDNEHPLMRAIFVARGPAFPKIASNQIKSFQNIEVYNIICDSLGLVPNKNNGTLRLPLQAIDEEDSDVALEVPVYSENTTITSSLGPQASSTGTCLPSKTCLTTIESLQPTDSTGMLPTEVPKLPKIDLNWIKDKQKEMWEWLSWKSGQLKNWWLEKLPGDNDKTNHGPF